MSTLVVVEAGSVRPVPLRRLGWVAWRRHRATLLTTVAVLGLLSVYLVVQGSRFRSAVVAARGCTPDDSPACRLLQDQLHGYNDNGLLITFLILLPGLIGVFAGAPLLAREMEHGTFRYTWTQGVGRMRWATVMIGSGAAGVVALLGAFGGLVSWYEQPFVDNLFRSRLDGQSFPVTGVAAPAWALAGFALGVLGGMLWRRVVPALLSAMAVWFGLAFTAATLLRPHYRTPLNTTDMDLPGNGMTLGQWWVEGGVRVDTSRLTAVLRAAGLDPLPDGTSSVAVSPAAAAGGQVDPVQYLLAHGFSQVTSFQPDSRYWSFQWIEAGWLLALSLLLLALTGWLLRRRSG